MQSSPSSETSHDEPTVTFFKVYPAAIAPMRADKAALGTLPTMAYRHCEPVRTASAFGWYIFPAEDIYLKWNGADTLILAEDEWLPLAPMQLPGFQDYWNAHAPEALKDLNPPYVSPLPAKGFVQVWSGLLCATQPGWSVLVRPPANIQTSHMYQCFEGIVESDQFQPFPLFINLQLLATDVVIKLSKEFPLFQVQPLQRVTYSDAAHQFEVREGLELAHDGLPCMSTETWANYRKTIRVAIANEQYETAEYTKATRKRTKHSDE